MYKVDIDIKKLIRLTPTKFQTLNLKERYDIEEWIENSPKILGEDLLIISKELPLPSGIRLDLLTIDKNANLVIIELKRDDSGRNVEWQAIKYASYCSNFLKEDIFEYYAVYLGSDEDEAQLKIEEFIDEEIENLNEKQRIVLVSKEFHSDVISAVFWLRDYEIDVVCVRLSPYLDGSGQLFITPDIIIPLPEAKDYIMKKEAKQKELKRSTRSSFSLEKSDLTDDELRKELIKTFQRKSNLTPRIIAFFEIISCEKRIFQRDEVKSRLFEEKHIGKSIGQAGRYLSNISQFLTKKSNPHLRQIIEFELGGMGETKDNYRIVPQYLTMLREVLKEIKQELPAVPDEE